MLREERLHLRRRARSRRRAPGEVLARSVQQAASGLRQRAAALVAHQRAGASVAIGARGAEMRPRVAAAGAASESRAVADGVAMMLVASDAEGSRRDGAGRFEGSQHALHLTVGAAVDSKMERSSHACASAGQRRGAAWHACASVHPRRRRHVQRLAQRPPRQRGEQKELDDHARARRAAQPTEEPAAQVGAERGGHRAVTVRHACRRSRGASAAAGARGRLGGRCGGRRRSVHNPSPIAVIAGDRARAGAGIRDRTAASPQATRLRPPTSRRPGTQANIAGRACRVRCRSTHHRVN